MTDTPEISEPNVAPLFPNRPSAAPLGPQEDVIKLLSAIGAEAEAGKIVGLILIAVDGPGACRSNTAGAFTFATAIAQLELLKAQLIINCLKQNGQIP